MAIIKLPHTLRAIISSPSKFHEVQRQRISPRFTNRHNSPSLTNGISMKIKEAIED